MGYKGLPVYEFLIDTKKKEDGISKMSIVDKPAMQSKFFMFTDEKHKYNFIDETKKMIAGLALIPNKYVYRNSDGQEFYGFFSEQTVIDLRNKFMKEKRNDQVNFEHAENTDAQNIYLVESYIVSTENQIKDLKKFGIDAPMGSWFVQYHVEDLNTFNQIKDQGFHGFSVEAFLDQQLVQLNNIENLNKTIMNKIIEKFKQVIAEVEAEEVKLGLTVEPVKADGQSTPTKSLSGDTKLAVETKPTELKVETVKLADTVLAKPADMPPAGMPTGNTSGATSGATAPAVQDIGKEKLNDLVDLKKDGTYDIAVTVANGVITEATVSAEQNLIKQTQLAEHQKVVDALNAEIVTLKADLKQPATKPAVNGTGVKKTFSKEELANMSTYERLAIARGFKPIK